MKLDTKYLIKSLRIIWYQTKYCKTEGNFGKIDLSRFRFLCVAFCFGWKVLKTNAMHLEGSYSPLCGTLSTLSAKKIVLVLRDPISTVVEF